jgi:hypothetical protein
MHRSFLAAALLLSTACSSDDDALTPCQKLFTDLCARAVKCNPNGPQVTVLRPTKSGDALVGFNYSDEADCQGGANFCKESGPVQACQDALAGSRCDVSSPGSPQGFVLPTACVGID